MDEERRYIILENGKPKNGEWAKWAEWVKDGIRSNKQEIKDLEQRVTDLTVAIKVQQVKVGLWGAIGASIPTIAAFIILYFTGKL